MTQFPTAPCAPSQVIGHELDLPQWRQLAQCARAAVGTYPVHVVQTALRFLMLEEALIRGRGNLTAAAKILGITRQAVQQMTHQFDLRTTVSTLRCESLGQMEAETEQQEFLPDRSASAAE